MNYVPWEISRLSHNTQFFPFHFNIFYPPPRHIISKIIFRNFISWLWLIFHPSIHIVLWITTLYLRSISSLTSIHTCVHAFVLYSYFLNSEFWFSFLLSFFSFFFFVVVGSTNLKFRDKISSLFSIFSCLYFTYSFTLWFEKKIIKGQKKKDPKGVDSNILQVRFVEFRSSAEFVSSSEF